MTTYRFSQIASNITVRVEPSDTDLERYVGLEHLDPESLKLRRWGSPSDVIGQKLKFWKGDIIYGKRRAYQRKLAVADFDGICSAHAMVLRAKPEVCLPEFLPFFLQSDLFHNRALEISVGSLSPTINWTTLAKQEFPLPPVDEQRRIADLLWAADDTLQGYAIALEKAETLRISLINDELAKFTEFIDMKDVCSKIIDGPHYPPKFSEKGIPFLLVSNLSSGSIDWDVSKWITQKAYEEIYPRINSEIGDVLYTVVGSFGVPVYVDWDRPFGFQRHVALLKPNRDLLDGYFLKYYLESNLGKHQANLRAVGLAQKTITLGALKQYKLPKVNMEQQKQIVEKVKTADFAITLLKVHIEKTKEVKKLLLSQFI